MRFPQKDLFWIIIRPMLGLTDYQLKIVMAAARSVPVEKRDTFLQRIAAILALPRTARSIDVTKKSRAG